MTYWQWLFCVYGQVSLCWWHCWVAGRAAANKMCFPHWPCRYADCRLHREGSWWCAVARCSQCDGLQPCLESKGQRGLFQHARNTKNIVQKHQKLTLAFAGKVLISWMRKVSGFTMMTRGIPVVCWTQHTRPGWFITSDHWQRAGDVLLPPFELHVQENNKAKHSKVKINQNKMRCFF